MQPKTWTLVQTIACWNWKCALMSAIVRSLVYLIAITRSGVHGRFGVVAVEMVYVTLTAGLYAGMQQRALALRSALLGNLAIVVGVPALAQLFDWLAHRTVGPAASFRAFLVSGIFALVSAFFHLHVMRRGAFLTGHASRTLADDFRRMPRLILSFVAGPCAWLSRASARFARAAQSESAF